MPWSESGDIRGVVRESGERTRIENGFYFDEESCEIFVCEESITDDPTEMVLDGFDARLPLSFEMRGCRRMKSPGDPVVGKEVRDWSPVARGSVEHLLELGISAVEIGAAIACECRVKASATGEALVGGNESFCRVVCGDFQMDCGCAEADEDDEVAFVGF